MRALLTLAVTILLGLLGLVLGGCGGSGGGTVNFTYSTDWTNYQAATGGQSERVELFSANGTLISSVVLNQGTTTISTSAFNSLPSGIYHLEVQLFSGQNVGGVEVGDLDAAVNVGQVTTFSTVVGGVVSSLKVTPATATVSVQGSRQFYVAGYTATSAATFVPTGSVTWSVLGSQGSVGASSGLFLGLSPGQCSVQASSNGLNAAAIVTVQSINTVQGTWTVMVYMNAANDLSAFSLSNFTQMQSVANNGTAVRTIVQWKQVSSLPYPAQFNGTRRYLITPSQSSQIASQLVQDMGTGVDMGNPQTLTDFVNWAKTFYPAQHYALIVWDHGAGWQRSVQAASTRAVSFDDEFGSAIQTWQLSQALGNNTFDILAWDASLMQQAEVADEIRSKVSYIVGSEESPPGAGYPYNLILSKFYNAPNSTPVTLADAFVDGMITEYGGDASDKITQSVIDTSKFPQLLTAINDLGSALSANVGSDASAVQAARQNTQAYSLSSTRFYFDLYDLTSKLDAGTSGIPAITAADAEVRAAVSSAIVYEKHNTLSPGSHGIAIDFSPGSVFVSYASDYAQLRLSTDTDWATWLTQAP